MRVLIVEDDQRLTRLMTQVLSEEHWAVDVAHDGDAGFELARSGLYDAAIVDWMLPGRDGPSLCRALRAARVTTPLLMLTARGQVEERVAGLDSGADDYLVKPFAFDELLARLRALSRRGTASAAAGGEELRAGDVVMDLRGRSARRGERPLALTTTEWSLLECLLRHPGQALSREQILNYVWSHERDVLPSLVDVYVSYLRRKLHTPGLADPIQTVRGRGYRFAAGEAG
ncbi:MAG: response regulator transcription factor [Anaerolineales bacterium]|nr:response regulator transcription factor [Anaerolineales bacterium]